MPYMCTCASDVVISKYTSRIRVRGTKRSTEQKERKKLSTGDILKMAEFLLKNNCFEFNGQVKHEKSFTAIGTKFASIYACIFMDEIETKFLQTQEFQPFM